MAESLTSRYRRRSRSRSLLIGAGVLIGILVLQVVTTIGGAVIAQQQASHAAEDTFAYVGDLTAERIARYADSAESVVNATTNSIEDAGDLDLGDLARILYLNLSRVPHVRGVYVGFPDGRLVSVSHTGTGYSSRIIEVDPAYRESLTVHDAKFVALGTTRTGLDYDPRVRPWYRAGADSRNTVWTQPYLHYSSTMTYASVARAARTMDGLIAVTAADVDVDRMAAILDSLPLGAGAEAFVLSPEGQVIAAPTAYADQLRDVANMSGEVPITADIGIGASDGAPTYSDGNLFSENLGRITLQRGFPPAEGLDWVLRLEADKSQLSPGLDRLQITIYAITTFSALMVLAVAALMYRMWRPLRRLSLRARTDQLTGLANRHELRIRGTALLRRARVHGDAVVVVALDLDNFKALNDARGHQAGDVALRVVGEALLAASRESDVVARLGGDEFVVMQVISDETAAPEVVERVRGAVEHAVRVQVSGGEDVGLTAGYSLTTLTSFDLDVLLARADAALLAGKRVDKGASYPYERPGEAGREAGASAGELVPKA